MNLRNHLLREAGKLASNQTVRRIQLSVEIGRLEGRHGLNGAETADIERLNADAQNCAQALLRFGTYRPHQEAEPSCPYCWIVQGEGSPLRPGARPESYQCVKCDAEYP
jgi:hypothetical protein